MSPDALRWVIGLGVFAHGVGHILFMPVLASTLRLSSSGHSWLLTGALGDGLTRLAASVAAGIAVAAFAAASVGIVAQLAWWRPVALAAAVLSVGVIVVMWDGLPTSSAVFALVFDAAVLVALLITQEATKPLAT